MEQEHLTTQRTKMLESWEKKNYFYTGLLQEKDIIPGDNYPIQFYIKESKQLIRNGQYRKAFYRLDKFYKKTQDFDIDRHIRLKLFRMIFYSGFKLINKGVKKSNEQQDRNLIKQTYSILVSLNSYLIHYYKVLVFVLKSRNHQKQKNQENTSQQSIRISEFEFNILSSSSSSSSYYDSQEEEDEIEDQMIHNENNANLPIHTIKNMPLPQLSNKEITQKLVNLSEIQELFPYEFNIKEYLNIFWRYTVQLYLKWIIYFKQLGQIEQALLFISKILKIEKLNKLQETHDIEILTNIGIILLQRSNIYMEMQKYNEALNSYEETFDIYQVLLCFYQNKMDKLGAKATQKDKDQISNHVKEFIVLLFNLALTVEFQREFSRQNECLTLAKWLQVHFLNDHQEIERLVNDRIKEMKDNYQRLIREEFEIISIIRILFPANKEKVKKKIETLTDFQKLNKHYYEKFNHKQLNQQIIIQKSLNPQNYPQIKQLLENSNNHYEKSNSLGNHIELKVRQSRIDVNQNQLFKSTPIQFSKSNTFTPKHQQQQNNNLENSMPKLQLQQTTSENPSQQYQIQQKENQKTSKFNEIQNQYQTPQNKQNSNKNNQLSNNNNNTNNNTLLQIQNSVSTNITNNNDTTLNYTNRSSFQNDTINNENFENNQEQQIPQKSLIQIKEQDQQSNSLSNSSTKNKFISNNTNTNKYYMNVQTGRSFVQKSQQISQTQMSNSQMSNNKQQYFKNSYDNKLNVQQNNNENNNYNYILIKKKQKKSLQQNLSQQQLKNEKQLNNRKSMLNSIIQRSYFGDQKLSSSRISYQGEQQQKQQKYLTSSFQEDQEIKQTKLLTTNKYFVPFNVEDRRKQIQSQNLYYALTSKNSDNKQQFNQQTALNSERSNNSVNSYTSSQQHQIMRKQQEDKLQEEKIKEEQKYSLDYQTDQIVQERIQNDDKHFLSYQEIADTKQFEEKEDEFDKKEFSFCKKILQHKKIYNKGIIEDEQANKTSKISNFEAEKLVQEEAHLLQEQIYAQNIIEEKQREILEIKKKKILNDATSGKYGNLVPGSNSKESQQKLTGQKFEDLYSPFPHQKQNNQPIDEKIDENKIKQVFFEAKEDIKKNLNNNENQVKNLENQIEKSQKNQKFFYKHSDLEIQKQQQIKENPNISQEQIITGMKKFKHSNEELGKSSLNCIYQEHRNKKKKNLPSSRQNLTLQRQLTKTEESINKSQSKLELDRFKRNKKSDMEHLQYFQEEQLKKIQNYNQLIENMQTSE